LILTFFDAADLLEREEQAIVNVTGDEADPDPLVGDDVGRWRSKEQCVPIEKREPNGHKKILPEVQSELTLQQPCQQHRAAQQDQQLLGGSQQCDRRLVNMELAILEGVLAAQVRYPCLGLPPHHQQSDHDDEKKTPRDDRRPRPQRDDSDPRVGDLLEEEVRDGKDEAIEKCLHALIINDRRTLVDKRIVLPRALEQSEGTINRILTAEYIIMQKHCGPESNWT